MREEKLGAIASTSDKTFLVDREVRTATKPETSPNENADATPSSPDKSLPVMLEGQLCLSLYLHMSVCPESLVRLKRLSSVKSTIARLFSSCVPGITENDVSDDPVIIGTHPF